MAYPTRYRGRRRKYRRYAKKSSTRSIAVSALKRVSRIPKPEYKVIYSNVASGDTYSGGAGLLTLLNGCAQGDGISSRDGRQIQMKSIQVRATFTSPVATTDPIIIRYVVFIDKSPRATAPTLSQVLDTSQGGPEETYRNLDYRKRFVILKDKVFIMDAHQGFDSAKAYFNRVHREIIKFKKLKLNTVFNSGSAGTIADIESGAIYLMLFGTSATYPVVADIMAVARFTDS